MNVTRDEFLRHEGSTRDVIDVKRIYVDMAGDLVAGVLLSQIIYWHLPNPDTGNSKLRVFHKGEYWVAKKREDWWKECRITAKQFDRAIKSLEEVNLVVTDVLKFDGAPVKHVRIDWAVFLASYENLLSSYAPEGVKSKLPKGQYPNSPKGNMELPQTSISLTETTSETTSEILEEDEAKPASRAPKERKAKTAKPTPLAVGVFREERNRFPPGRWYAEIDAAVGVEPRNLELWRQILHAWEGNGWNPLAVKGPLDYFQRREIPGAKKNGKPTMLDNYAEAQRILEDVKNGKRDGDAGIVADIFSSISGTSAQAEGFGGFDSDVGSGPG